MMISLFYGVSVRRRLNGRFSFHIYIFYSAFIRVFGAQIDFVLEKKRTSPLLYLKFVKDHIYPIGEKKKQFFV